VNNLQGNVWPNPRVGGFFIKLTKTRLT